MAAGGFPDDPVGAEDPEETADVGGGFFGVQFLQAEMDRQIFISETFDSELPPADGREESLVFVGPWSQSPNLSLPVGDRATFRPQEFTEGLARI